MATDLSINFKDFSAKLRKKSMIKGKYTPNSKASILSIGFIVSFSFFGCSLSSTGLRHSKDTLNNTQRKSIVITAKKYMGVKYKNGGTTPSGFDCSGYVMYVYNKNGIRVPRAVQEQYKAGKTVPIRHARPGDLVFFTTGRNRYSHVGIYLGNLRFIHAPSTGKTVSIASMKNSYWKSRFIGSVAIVNTKSRPLALSSQQSPSGKHDKNDLEVYN